MGIIHWQELKTITHPSTFTNIISTTALSDPSTTTTGVAQLSPLTGPYRRLPRRSSPASTELSSDLWSSLLGPAPRGSALLGGQRHTIASSSLQLLFYYSSSPLFKRVVLPSHFTHFPGTSRFLTWSDGYTQSA